MVQKLEDWLVLRGRNERDVDVEKTKRPRDLPEAREDLVFDSAP
jgi:hypothetical protein